jgi:chromosome segregation ATPase
MPFCFWYRRHSRNETAEELRGLRSTIEELKREVRKMATAAQLQAAADAIKAEIAKVGTDVAAVIAALTALQGQSGGIQPTDLDPVLSALNDINTSLGSTDAALVAALPPVAPQP